jgi:hypothetical protein
MTQKRALTILHPIYNAKIFNNTLNHFNRASLLTEPILKKLQILVRQSLFLRTQSFEQRNLNRDRPNHEDTKKKIYENAFSFSYSAVSFQGQGTGSSARERAHSRFMT